MSCFGCIRHSRTVWNEEERVQGWRDSPLTDKGQALARRWGEQLAVFPWQRILASDLGRARQTAQLINASLHLPLHTEPRLREQDWGEWSGLLYSELLTERKKEFARQERRGWDFRPPGGESRREVLRRSLAALGEASCQWPDAHILVVSHEGVIRCLACHLAGHTFLPGAPSLLREWHLHCFSARDGELFLQELNCLRLQRPDQASPFSLF